MHEVSSFTTRILVVVFLAVVGISHTHTQEVERGGGSSNGDGFWFQAGGLSLKKDTPGVIFGMTKKPDGDRELAYVVLFKHLLNAKSKVVTSGKVRDKDGKARVVTMADGIEIDDKKFGLTLTIEVDRATKAVKSEELVFAGKAIDLKKGRVFLVDLTTAEPKWQQVAAKLPTKLPDPRELADVRQVVKRVLAELLKDSDATRKFLK